MVWPKKQKKKCFVDGNVDLMIVTGQGISWALFTFLIGVSSK